MENNIFNLNRFNKLIIRDIKSRKFWIQILLVIAGFPLLLFLINLSDIGTHISLLNRASFLEGLVTGMVIISPFVLYFNYNHPKKGLTEVMLPASVFEKYLVMQLTCLIFTPLLIIIIYGSMDSLLSLLFPGIQQGYVLQYTIDKGINWNYITVCLLFLQAIFFFNLLLVRQKVGKTVAIFILSMIVLIALLFITVSIWDSISSWTDVNHYNFDLSDRGLFTIYADDHPIVIIILIIRIFLKVILPPALMIGSYFVMKNKRY